MNDGATRSRVIRYSLRCFVAGLLALIPVLGLPAAVFSLVYWIKALRRGRRAWNPASVYLHLGAVFAVLGVVLSLASVALLVYYIANVYDQQVHHDYDFS